MEGPCSENYRHWSQLVTGGILVPPLMELDVEVGPVIQPLSLSLPTCKMRAIVPTVVLSGVRVRVTWDRNVRVSGTE